MRIQSRKRTLCALTVFIALTFAACAPKGEELYARAAASLKEGDVNAAIIDLKNLIQAEPQNGKARALLGQALVATGDFNLAEVELQKAKDLGVPEAAMLASKCRIFLAKAQFEEALAQCKPESAPADSKLELQLAQGHAFLGLGRMADAKTVFQSAVDEQPENLDALLGLVSATANLESIKAGITLLEGAPASVKNQAQYWLALGALQVQSPDLAAAEKAYKTAVERTEESDDKRVRMMALGGLAETQMRRGDVAAADATSDKLLKLAPKHPLAKQLRGQVAAAGGKFDEARTLLEEVVTEMPENPDARILLGYVHLQQGNLDQAEMHVQTVVAKNPSNPAAQKLMAEIRAKQQTPAESLASVKSALAQTSNDPTMLAVAGRMSLASGDREQAMSYLAEASKSGDKLTPAAQLEVANSYLMAGEPDKALEILRSMPDSSAVSYQRDLMMLLSLQRKGDEAELIKQANAVLARSGKDPVVRNMVGSIYVVAGRMDLAREQFDEAIRLAPKDVSSLNNRGKLELVQGKPAAAEPYFKKALEIDPKNLMATMALAAAAGERKDTQAAEKYLIKAKNDHPDSVGAQATLARFYLGANQPKKAREVMDAAVAANPRSAGMANARGVMLIGTREVPEAIASFEEAIRLDPKGEEYALNLARAKAVNGDFKGSLAVLDAFLQQQPRSMPALALAAASSLRSGDLERATGYVERVRQASPGSTLSNQLEGDLALAEKRYRDALAAYEKADPKMLDRNITMARYAAAAGAGSPRPEKVIEDWVAQHPDDADAIALIAEAKRKSGDTAGAISMYERGIAKAPGSAFLHNNLAMIYLETGDPRALRTAEVAYKLLPKAPAIQDTYGWALFKSGQAGKAIEPLSSAAKALPNEAEVQYHLAAALAADGRKAEALPLAKKAVAGTLSPTVRVEATRLLAELQ